MFNKTKKTPKRVGVVKEIRYTTVFEPFYEMQFDSDKDLEETLDAFAKNINRAIKDFAKERHLKYRIEMIKREWKEGEKDDE